MSMTDLDKAQAVADAIRGAWPEKAAAIDKLIEKARRSKNDGIPLRVNLSYRLEKFDGDYEPGKVPVEVIEGSERLVGA